MKLPTVKEIEALHRKYAPSAAAFERVFTHCQIVWDIANQLIARNNLTVDAALVKVGCLLHDIGVYPLFDERGVIIKGVRHGVEGEIILKNEGFSEVLWRFPSHHTGVGLSRQDVIDQKLPIPVADYLAETDEELLVMYADKFHSKNNTLHDAPFFCSFERYRLEIARFGADKVLKFDGMARRFGVPDLEPLAKKYVLEVK
ncbi:HD domain-containing protein [Candidatus Saccharibacteria bacterium]|nr:HD domain-containing protein [Candidatus Saccharibacteria bacterium]